MEYAYKFTNAITRIPSKSVIKGLRAFDIGAPDLNQMILDHQDYTLALQEAGAKIIELPPLEKYPDSLFVEDTTLCLPNVAILMRPGAPSRMGEVLEIEPIICEMFNNVVKILKPGLIEAGDILTTGKEVLVGSSARTNSEGIHQLREILSKWNYIVREVVTPKEILHFKTDCSILGPETVLCTKRLEKTGCFSNYQVINTHDGEEAAANAIRYNDTVIIPSGFPVTSSRIRDAGYSVREVNNSECAKLDGGMSCLSLRF